MVLHSQPKNKVPKKKKAEKYIGAFADDDIGKEPFFLKPSKLKSKFKNI